MSNETTDQGTDAVATSPTSGDPATVTETLRSMVAEEMFLLGQELNDSLDSDQQARLTELTASLDEVCDLMASHRATTRR